MSPQIGKAEKIREKNRLRQSKSLNGIINKMSTLTVGLKKKKWISEMQVLEAIGKDHNKPN